MKQSETGWTWEKIKSGIDRGGIRMMERERRVNEKRWGYLGTTGKNY